MFIFIHQKCQSMPTKVFINIYSSTTLQAIQINNSDQILQNNHHLNIKCFFFFVVFLSFVFCMCVIHFLLHMVTYLFCFYFHVVSHHLTNYHRLIFGIHSAHFLKALLFFVKVKQKVIKVQKYKK